MYYSFLRHFQIHANLVQAVGRYDYHAPDTIEIVSPPRLTTVVSQLSGRAGFIDAWGHTEMCNTHGICGTDEDR